MPNARCVRRQNRFLRLLDRCEVRLVLLPSAHRAGRRAAAGTCKHLQNRPERQFTIQVSVLKPSSCNCLRVVERPSCWARCAGDGGTGFQSVVVDSLDIGSLGPIPKPSRIKSALEFPRLRLGFRIGSRRPEGTGSMRFLYGSASTLWAISRAASSRVVSATPHRSGQNAQVHIATERSLMAKFA
jgi:hypothetical protein